MKKILLSAAIVLTVCTVKAQYVNDYLRAADDYFKKADYYSTAQYYEKYLSGGKESANKDVYNPYAVKTANKKTALFTWLPIPISPFFPTLHRSTDLCYLAVEEN